MTKLLGDLLTAAAIAAMLAGAAVLAGVNLGEALAGLFEAL